MHLRGFLPPRTPAVLLYPIQATATFGTQLRCLPLLIGSWCSCLLTTFQALAKLSRSLTCLPFQTFKVSKSVKEIVGFSLQQILIDVYVQMLGNNHFINAVL